MIQSGKRIIVATSFPEIELHWSFVDYNCWFGFKTGIEFPELEQLERIIEQFGAQAQTGVIEQIQYQDHEFPIHCITLGSTRPDVPVLAFFGGVHGLEKPRLVFVPIVIPVGVYLGTRCNGNGVDLMRNSPVEDVGAPRICSGQRITPRLPWYRGDESNMGKNC